MARETGRTAARSFADGRYRVDRVLGRGGMATVYLAHDRELDRPVAVKVLSGRYAGDDDFARRFRREALTAARLAHPNIVQVYDAGDEAGELFIVMELVEGEGLDAVLAREHRLDPARVVALGRQACAALGYAHAHGVVHRDVKPANLLVRADGVLKVTDFGIARAVDATQLTQAGTLLGTAAYIAPEQARGEPAGPEADVFSVGVVLYELLTGEPPWRVETLAQLAVVGETPPRPLRELAPGTPPELEAAVLRCLARDPRDRPPSAEALAAELEPRGAPGEATVPLERPTVPLDRSSAPTRAVAAREQRVRRAAGPRRFPFRLVVPVLAVLALAALVGVLAVATIRDGRTTEAPTNVERAPRAPDPARQARDLADWIRDHTAEAD